MKLGQQGDQRYSGIAMLFHWAIAVAVIVNWRLAESAHHSGGPDAGWYWAQHKALGITILILSLGRLAWRLTHKFPPLLRSIPAWQRILARTTHVIFYILLIGLPVGGWLAVSYRDGDIDLWGLATIPALPVAPNDATAETVGGLHGTVAELMIYLIGLHILGALKHTFFDKGLGIFRMLPFGGWGDSGTTLR